MRRTGRAGRVWAASAVVALAVGLVAGCDGDRGDPTPTPSSSEPSTSETTTEPESTEPSTPAWTPPDIDPPEAPPEMSVDDETGAVAFAYYFLQTYNYGRLTGEMARFEATFGEDCAWCLDVSAAVAQVYEDGGWIEQAELTYDIATAQVGLPTADEPTYVVMVDVVDEPFTAVAGDGTETVSERQEFEPMLIEVLYSGGRFLTMAVERGES